MIMIYNILMNTKISLLIRDFIDINDYHVLLSLLSIRLHFIENLPYVSSTSMKPFKLCNNMICSKQLPDIYSSSSSSSILSYSLQYLHSQGYGLICNNTIKKNEHLMVL